MTQVDWLSAAITQYGYLALLLGAIVEGPVATIFGAFLAAHGELSLDMVFVVAVLGDLIGDLLHYAVGRSASGPLSAWRNRFSARRKRQWAIVRDHLYAHAGKTLLFGKLTHVAGFIVLIASGVVRVPLGPFLGYNLLGALPKTAVLVLVGYTVGMAYRKLDVYLWIAACLVLALTVYGVHRYLSRHLSVDTLGP